MHSSLRNKMESGKPLLGILCLIHHPAVMELAGWCGADFVVVDGEHAPVAHSALESIVRAAEVAAIVPVIRTFMVTGNELLPYLDMGFRGVMVPHLKTPEEARKMVRFTQFPPLGVRSISPGRISSYNTRKQTMDYLRRVSHEILVIAQLEDKEAADNIEGLLDVDGVDIYNIGAADLAASMGHPLDPGHAEVRAVITEMVEAASRKGRFTGNPGWDDAVRRDFFAKGARSFLIPDTQLLAGGIQTQVADLKKLSGA